ncbi:MAG: DUF1080 domain-containing protein [Tannerella sp.]|jgi:glyoxylase-like metal-dependent hydrolase (beta-lactamase superfamily II)|nr:DUF1080 domain-containing protein [Tannerella sp.]
MKTILKSTAGLLILLCAGNAMDGQASFRAEDEVLNGTSASVPNSLTEQEQADGWKLLFDGKTSAGWRGAHKETFPEHGWKVEDGQLIVFKSNGGEATNGGDIVSEGEYAAFELSVEFKITTGANSGIKYFVTEGEKQSGSAYGLEYQILDDAVHPDAKLYTSFPGSRTLSSLYDLIPAEHKQVNPVGEWNQAVVKVFPGNHVEHWLNGVKTLEYERGSEAFRALVKGSKYAAESYNKNGLFGEAPRGRILLQDHGDEVAFRNIKIRELKLEGSVAEQENVITFEVGFSRITTLSEGQHDGNSSVLTGATPEMLRTWLPDGTYPGATNVFLIRTPDKNILVDAGYGRRLFDNLQTLEITPGQIDVILITHMHGDHIGGLLQEDRAAFPGAALYLSQAEHDYWTSDQAMQQVASNRRSGFLQARKVIAAYKDRLHLFTPHEAGATGAELIPGIQALAAYGHTPGHTAFLITSDGDRLLIWGDLTHATAIQMPCPDVAVVYDTDPVKAVEIRKKIMEYVAANDIPIAGMHIAFPAVGDVIRAEKGYTFKPFCLCLGI